MHCESRSLTMYCTLIQDVPDSLTDGGTPNTAPLSLYINVNDLPDTPPIVSVPSINEANEPEAGADLVSHS